MSNNFFDTLRQNLSCMSTIFKTIRRNLAGKKFESEVFELHRFIKKGSVCVDVGAAYGRYAFNISKLVGEAGKVYCFEPGDYSFKVLSTVVKYHKMNNVVKVKKALSDSKGVEKLIIPIKERGQIGPSLARLGDAANSNEISQDNVEVTTLDDFCEENGIEKVVFIKCDVEGAEVKFFKGAQKVIDRDKPAILCEVEGDHLIKFGSTPEQFYDSFVEKGYQIFILKNRQFIKVKSMQENHNYFFIHSSSEAINLL